MALNLPPDLYLRCTLLLALLLSATIVHARTNGLVTARGLSPVPQTAASFVTDRRPSSVARRLREPAALVATPPPEGSGVKLAPSQCEFVPRYKCPAVYCGNWVL
ncbi:hypothetical protein CLOM_g4012 [Closterium sp. NIES-68]|nr:hypothetical protein CLOM_g4012 [Closterium sp. NIES-68]GJP72529.1 hypothetical protein CLOP_g3256 [Closterium sp. NIES-67]